MQTLFIIFTEIPLSTIAAVKRGQDLLNLIDFRQDQLRDHAACLARFQRVGPNIDRRDRNPLVKGPGQPKHHISIWLRSPPSHTPASAADAVAATFAAVGIAAGACGATIQTSLVPGQNAGAGSGDQEDEIDLGCAGTGEDGEEIFQGGVAVFEDVVEASGGRGELMSSA